MIFLIPRPLAAASFIFDYLGPYWVFSDNMLSKTEGILSILIMTERSDIHKSSTFNLQSSIPACPGRAKS
jgi:hypothetical protein